MPKLYFIKLTDTNTYKMGVTECDNEYKLMSVYRPYVDIEVLYLSENFDCQYKERIEGQIHHIFVERGEYLVTVSENNYKKFHIIESQVNNIIDRLRTVLHDTLYPYIPNNQEELGYELEI